MTFMVPINMVSTKELEATRAQLAKKMVEEGKLTQGEAAYLDGAITELNRRNGIE